MQTNRGFCLDITRHVCRNNGVYSTILNSELILLDNGILSILSPIVYLFSEALSPCRSYQLVYIAIMGPLPPGPPLHSLVALIKAIGMLWTINQQLFIIMTNVGRGTPTGNEADKPT